MGPEPFIDAMTAEPDFDIIIGGRAYDPSPYIAYCVHLATSKLSLPLAFLTSQQLGGYAFMGKVMECGVLCSTPKSHSAQSIVYIDGTLDIKVLSSDSRCTHSSVAAHALYEKGRPDVLPGPGGNLDLNHSKYEQLHDGRSVRVSGAEFYLSQVAGHSYSVRLEAAKVVGYRAMMIGRIRDPILISQIYKFLGPAKEHVVQQYNEAVGDWQLYFHIYGMNGIMGDLEPGDPSYKPRETFVVGESLASKQDIANSIASTARIGCVHGPYPEQHGTGGNFAMGVGGKLTLETGPCTEFCIYHLIPVLEGEEGVRRLDRKADSATRLEWQITGMPLFSWRMTTIGKGESMAVFPTYPRSSIQANGYEPPQTRASKQPQIPVDPPLTLKLTQLRTLCDIAPVVRSKNSGPYDSTLGVVFLNSAIYNLLKNSEMLTRAIIASLYRLSEDEIIY